MAWTNLDEARVAADTPENHLSDHNQLHQANNWREYIDTRESIPQGDNASDYSSEFQTLVDQADTDGRAIRISSRTTIPVADILVPPSVSIYGHRARGTHTTDSGLKFEQWPMLEYSGAGGTTGDCVLRVGKEGITPPSGFDDKSITNWWMRDLFISASNADYGWRVVNPSDFPTVDTEFIGDTVNLTDDIIVASTDRVHATGHGLNNARRIQFNALAGGTGLSTDTDYWVINKTTDDFQVSTSMGGSAVDITVDYSSGSFRTFTPASTDNVYIDRVSGSGSQVAWGYTGYATNFTHRGGRLDGWGGTGYKVDGSATCLIQFEQMHAKDNANNGGLGDFNSFIWYDGGTQFGTLEVPYTNTERTGSNDHVFVRVSGPTQGGAAKSILLGGWYSTGGSGTNVAIVGIEDGDRNGVYVEVGSTRQTTAKIPNLLAEWTGDFATGAPDAKIARVVNKAVDPGGIWAPSDAFYDATDGATRSWV